jgi:hypothetical protein
MKVTLKQKLSVGAKSLLLFLNPKRAFGSISAVVSRFCEFNEGAGNRIMILSADSTSDFTTDSEVSLYDAQITQADVDTLAESAATENAGGYEFDLTNIDWEGGGGVAVEMQDAGGNSINYTTATTIEEINGLFEDTGTVDGSKLVFETFPTGYDGSEYVAIHNLAIGNSSTVNFPVIELDGELSPVTRFFRKNATNSDGKIIKNAWHGETSGVVSRVYPDGSKKNYSTFLNDITDGDFESVIGGPVREILVDQPGDQIFVTQGPDDLIRPLGTEADHTDESGEEFILTLEKQSTGKIFE